MNFSNETGAISYHSQGATKFNLFVHPCFGRKDFDYIIYRHKIIKIKRENKVRSRECRASQHTWVFTCFYIKLRVSIYIKKLLLPDLGKLEQEARITQIRANKERVV